MNHEIDRPGYNLKRDPPRPVPENTPDIADKKHGEFWAMAQGRTDYVLPAFPIDHPIYGPMLTMTASEEVVYITKVQAMAFFDLVEKA